MAISVFDQDPDLSDIDAMMDWLRLGSRSRNESGRVLLDSRESLSSSIVRAVENRRDDGRLAVAGKRAGMGGQDWVLVNTSQRGMAIRVWGRAPFARGERYTISLRAGAVRAEVEGRVCWTRSSWHRDLFGGGRQAYCQTAGFSVGDNLSVEQVQRWLAVQELAEERSVRLEIGLVTQYRQAKRNGVVVPFKLRAATN